MTTNLGIARRSRAGRFTAIAAAQIVAALGAGSTADAATATALYAFTGGNDGANPYSGLYVDSSGNFYGTTFSGGVSGQGVLFMVPSGGGTSTTLYSFTGSSADGAGPTSTPVFDGTNFLGTTVYTSVNSNGVGSGYGNIYELGPNGAGGWTPNNIHSFASGSDGAKPYAGLSNFESTGNGTGNYYGATYAGGTSGYGIVFKITKGSSGVYTYNNTPLYSFRGGSTDGGSCYGTLVFFSSNLYGTTVNGGSASSEGIAFKLSTGGSTASPGVFSFTGSGTVGGFPRGGVILDAYGNLYGTTMSYGSGSYSGDGVVFKLTPPVRGTGTYTYVNLHPFTGSGSDGAYPWSSLVSDSSLNLYGTTTSGGSYGYGAVFELMKGTNGGYTYVSLWSFTGGNDGANPQAALTPPDANGNLYGTTLNGGANGKGVVFKVTTP